MNQGQPNAGGPVTILRPNASLPIPRFIYHICSSGVCDSQYNLQSSPNNDLEMQFDSPPALNAFPSRPVSIETQHCYNILLGVRSLAVENLRPQECDLLSQYFIRTYEAYKDFHGGLQGEYQGLSVLARRPRLGKDILIIPRLDHDTPLYQLHTKWCSRLSAAIAGVMRHLAIMYSRSASPTAWERYERTFSTTLVDPYSVFSWHHITYIDPPCGVNQINALTRCFDDLADLEEFVRSVQLWVAFMRPLCSLLATKLDIPGVPRFRVSMFQHSEVLILAHNWLMDCIGAPTDMKARLPGSE